jgi:hypothetical protein
MLTGGRAIVWAPLSCADLPAQGILVHAEMQRWSIWDPTQPHNDVVLGLGYDYKVGNSQLASNSTVVFHAVITV